MALWLLILLYTLAFFSLYTQVFFLLSYLENRDIMKKQEQRRVADEDLPAVTMIVPCWNEEASVYDSIQSIFDIDYPMDRFHVIAVDDGSTDNTWQELQRFAGDARITLLQKENGGKHSALNFAIPHVTTPYMCCIDADTTFEPQSLRELVTYAVFEPEVAAVAGTVLIKKPSTIFQMAQNIEYQMFAFNKKVLGLLHGVLVAPGAFSLFKTQVVRAVGGYRQAHNMEDLELTYRLQVHGHRVEHCHSGIAYTTGPRTLKALFKQRMRWSYGFLHNTRDYKYAIFNKSYGSFGVFTLPMSLFAYVVVVVLFFLSWYYFINFFVDAITLIRLAGMSAFAGSLVNFDWFFINTQAFFFLSSLMVIIVVATILLGRKTSKLPMLSHIGHVVWFFGLYNLLAPFWIMSSILNVIRSHQPSWR
ncbi:MAG: glycosyltransferase family 2 protein [Candidatus Pacebacteria bacterium]|nr:glycosyltransferase family 2 protein [Candidatus Paceibacterota bacterium]MCD8563772.1 glycosyltransferase family 2 protein [Candidatus Paceibacterota bacterium]